jgi:catechol 2,3-dioxygenase-like lactoylglutathione lyase family enzyme
MNAPHLTRQFHGVAPSFFVADVVKAAAYYEQKLGFRSAQLWGNPPAFAIPTREHVQVMLSQKDPSLIHPKGAHPQTMDAYFFVTDVDALHAEFLAKGADIVSGPKDETAYGMREILVRDLDGHVLIFAHDISAKAN